MKNFSQTLGLTLALGALLLSACSKKPIRTTPADTTSAQMGPNNSLDPTKLAIPGDDTGLQPRDTDAGAVVDANKSVVEPVYFGLDRSAVSPAERPKIEAAVKWLKDNADKHLVLVGHCDWRGTAEYNLGLGDRRANAVKTYLQSLGADPTRLETLSKGSTDAKQSGTDADWKKDRRVDFVILTR